MVAGKLQMVNLLQAGRILLCWSWKIKWKNATKCCEQVCILEANNKKGWIRKIGAQIGRVWDEKLYSSTPLSWSPPRSARPRTESDEKTCCRQWPCCKQCCRQCCRLSQWENQPPKKPTCFGNSDDPKLSRLRRRYIIFHTQHTPPTWRLREYIFSPSTFPPIFFLIESTFICHSIISSLVSLDLLTLKKT